MLGAGYLWVKAIHIIFVIAWMAGLLYLPRLFVYHCEAEPGSAADERFKIMERRLMNAIMNPAMVITLGVGTVLLINLDQWRAGWVHVKLLALLGLVIVHFLMNRWRLDFARDRNRHTARFFRAINEVPTVLMMVIVIMAVVRPF